MNCAVKEIDTNSGPTVQPRRCICLCHQKWDGANPSATNFRARLCPMNGRQFLTEPMLAANFATIDPDESTVAWMWMMTQTNVGRTMHPDPSAWAVHGDAVHRENPAARVILHLPFA